MTEARVAASSACPASYSGALKASLVYDPAGRLHEASGGTAGTTQFLYDGDVLVAEYDGTTLLKRYVHGPSVDEPLVYYDPTTRRNMFADHQGSIIALTQSSGTMVAINSYDPYGVPGADNEGRFQYTGQIWIPQLGLYHYKARAYSPSLGRFMQTDPIGYEDQVNLYAYIGNDPLNGRDPTGEEEEEVVVEGQREQGSGISWLLTRPIIPRVQIDLPDRVIAFAQVLGFSEKCIESTSIADCSTSEKINAVLLLSLPRDIIAIGRSSVASFSASAKHFAGSGGRYAKFLSSDQRVIRTIITSGLRNPQSVNYQARSGNYVVLSRFSSSVGSRGERGLKIVISPTGKIITAYPVK